MENSLLPTSLGKKIFEFTVLVASRNAKAIDHLEKMLTPVKALNIQRNHICNGHSDPLFGLVKMPNLLIFWVSTNWQVELEELISRPAAERPPLIICANNDDAQLMRKAMKAGAVDYLRSPIVAGEFVAVVCGVLDEFRKSNTEKSGEIVAIINAKGGSGASFIACNIADLMAESSHLQVALLGLDIQFGSLSGYLDMDARYGLIEALDNIDDMDSDALKGYMMSHPSGIDLLDVKLDELLTPEDIDVDSLSRLLSLLSSNYDQVIVDLPRQIDSLTSEVIESADKILVVLQQSIAHLHDAKRLLELLRRDLGVASERIFLVINRYDKRSDLTLNDLSKALNHQNLMTIPNAFDEVSKSLIVGELLYKCSKRAAITKALLLMKDSLLGYEPKTKFSVFNRVIKHLKVSKL
ncbi:MAG: AAA family ATPase [Spongiibacteraceae bacterium]|nr:AAA family ATPase [Spongiibacteraceae bacterium]